MFKLKKILNSNVVAPEIIKITGEKGYGVPPEIEPGMAIFEDRYGVYQKCERMYRPTHICVGKGKNPDGTRYILCYTITDDMIFEVPFLTDESINDVNIGGSVFVDRDSNCMAVKFDITNTPYCGILVYKENFNEYTPYDKVLVRFPYHREGY